MKHVKAVPRANGAVDLYLRKAGLPLVKLKASLPPAGQEAGSDLEREVAAWIAALSPAATAEPTTLGQACRRYELDDAGFAILAAETKTLYRGYLKEFEDTLGPVPIAGFTPAFVQALRDRWAKRGHRAANLRLQVLKNVLKASLVAGTLDKDPFGLVANVARPHGRAEPHILWPIDVVVGLAEAAVMRENYGLARAIIFGRYVGARRGDLVAVTKGVRSGGRITFRSGKKGVLVDILEDPELTRWFARLPDRPAARPRAGRKVKRDATPVTPLNLVFNLKGLAYTEDGLGQALAALVADKALLNVTGGLGYDLHGLRHTRGVELALAGCTDAEGAAQLGHASSASFAQYRRQADRIRLADDAAGKIARLRERTGDKAAARSGTTGGTEVAQQP